jgi:hypothetical protein
MRLCDLGVRLEDTWLVGPVQTLYEELTAKGIRLRPHCWLSSEWFCPDGVPGIAIPFFLAHPRLMQLERRQMLEVEGGTRAECMKLLRHEAGHAVQHAFNLHRKASYRRVFGRSSTPYPEYYRPNPASKRFVVNLDLWYAQSHPDEDFAETFAVWLKPRSGWRKQYKGWSALKKLTYVDEIMKELAGTKPLVSTRERVETMRSLKMTLADYYEQKREHYNPGNAETYDRDLERVFDAPGAGGEAAASFLRRNRKTIRTKVAQWTGEYQVTLESVLRDMIDGCRRLGLRAVRPESELLTDFCVLLTVKTMHYVYRGREWHPV